MPRTARLPAALAALAALACLSPAQASEPARLLHAWADAHTAGTADRAAALYAPTARVWSAAAPHAWVGHEDIGHYLAVFPLGPSRPGFRIDTYTLQPIGPTVVVASGRYAVLRERWDGSTAEEPARFSLTMAQDGTGTWRIVEQYSSALPQ
jgi:hypothetical protein